MNDTNKKCDKCFESSISGLVIGGILGTLFGIMIGGMWWTFDHKSYWTISDNKATNYFTFTVATDPSIYGKFQKQSSCDSWYDYGAELRPDGENISWFFHDPKDTMEVRKIVIKALKGEK